MGFICGAIAARREGCGETPATQLHSASWCTWHEAGVSQDGVKTRRMLPSLQGSPALWCAMFPLPPVQPAAPGIQFHLQPDCFQITVKGPAVHNKMQMCQSSFCSYHGRRRPRLHFCQHCTSARIALLPHGRGAHRWEGFVQPCTDTVLLSSWCWGGGNTAVPSPRLTL